MITSLEDLETLLKDAERYRKIRMGSFLEGSVFPMVCCSENDNDNYVPESGALDALVDAMNIDF